MIGTPGCLAPEQESAGPVGPPSDVFALGCALVYAAVGRGPFGRGGVGALFRTVHEEPDLTGLPPGLVPLITARPAKGSAARPPAIRIRDTPGGGRRGRARGPRAYPGRPGAPDPSEAPGTGPGHWPMPPGCPRGSPSGPRAPGPRSGLLADWGRTGVLPFPALPQTTADRRGGPCGKRFRRGLDRPAGERHRGGRIRDDATYTIGLHADLSGPGRATGLAHRRGVKLAIADHNAREDTVFRFAPRTADDADDAGDPATALRTADRLAADPSVIAVIGPTGDTLRADLVSRYGTARLALVVVAAGSSAVQPATGRHHRVTRPLDHMLTAGLISYPTHTRPAERVLLVEDAADAGLGGRIGRVFRDLPLPGFTLLEQPLAPGNASFGTVARKAVSGRADAVLFAGGDASRAARPAVAPAGEGVTGTRVSAGPALSPAFLRAGGEAAEGWGFAQAYADPAALPTARAFTAAHRRRFGVPPATWAAEAYEAPGLIARAAGTTSASDEVRSGITHRLVRTEHRGIVRTLAFHAATRAVRYENGVFLYRTASSSTGSRITAPVS
ncbi:ABC transporter substrate-binding protein [Streptomyces sp. NPDC006798]|uniref:ABC transporter substrate-binding protein n=1 Tax=Streptomyces sp. NPDC006798 TaxID=3155462 RepID=UPI0033C63C77